MFIKPFQNNKGKKKIPGAQFLVSFSQLPAVKKDTNCALGDFFGPSYFVTTLVHGMYNFACFVSLSSNDIFANLSHSFASGGDK